jgi:excisionase family DNA binding protein
MPEFLTVREYASMAHYSESHVRRLVAKDRLPSERFGRGVRIPVSSMPPAVRFEGDVVIITLENGVEFRVSCPDRRMQVFVPKHAKLLAPRTAPPDALARP